MDELTARKEMPIWSGSRQAQQEFREMLGPNPSAGKAGTSPFMGGFVDWGRMGRKYGLSLLVVFVWAASMILGCCITGTIVKRNTEREVTERVTSEMRGNMHRFMEEQEQARMAAGLVTGEASLQEAIARETDAVAAVIAKLSTDAQKATEAACMLARVMSPAYPNSFEAVAAQPQQWMFYDGTDLTFSQHDREIAESIVRPYMESGIIPNGLTAEMVYGSWSTNDFVLRDSYQTTATMQTWRYQG